MEVMQMVLTEEIPKSKTSSEVEAGEKSTHTNKSPLYGCHRLPRPSPALRH